MTESQWLTSTDPSEMLQWLLGGPGVEERFEHHTRPAAVEERFEHHARPAASGRKLRLFAVACCRQPASWSLLQDDAPCGRCGGEGLYERPFLSDQRDVKCPDCSGTGRINRSRHAVKVAEGYADGKATKDELLYAFGQAARVDGTTPQQYVSAYDAMQTCVSNPTAAALNVAREPRILRPEQMVALLHDIFGNPFRPVTLQEECVCCRGRGCVGMVGNHWQTRPCETCAGKGRRLPDWLRWRDGIIPALAQEMYDSRDFTRMPLLADMLDDASCCDAQILDHCRGGGPHARGCWAVDSILGKS